MTSDELKRVRAELRSRRPLIHCITNPISINQCANAVLAVGARPIMAEHPSEVGEITDTAQALLLNLGNITDVRMRSMPISAEHAQKNGIPIVLDAVGAACSTLRRDFACKLIKAYRPSVIKGNYDELEALHNPAYRSLGVDSAPASSTAHIDGIAVQAARELGAVILASGKIDVITDGKRLLHIKNGTAQLAAVTGTGCMLGALCASYAAVSDKLTAAVCACALQGICGELAETPVGCGSFIAGLLDRLSTISDAELEKHLKSEEIEIAKL